jgi:hypothetical protein
VRFRHFGQAAGSRHTISRAVINLRTILHTLEALAACSVQDVAELPVARIIVREVNHLVGRVPDWRKGTDFLGQALGVTWTQCVNISAEPNIYLRDISLPTS